MAIDNLFEPTTQSRFEAEKLFRVIQECDDIEVLRSISIELVNLYQKKSAIANWATKMAARAEVSSVMNYKNTKE